MQNTPDRLQIEERELTDLQGMLPLGYLGREMELVDYMMLDILDINKRVRALAENQDEIVILDAGCGAGTSIEERVRTQQAVLRREVRSGIKLVGIGVDINPVPHLIPRNILSINPESGMQDEQGAMHSLVASIRQDDITELGTVPSNSVDIIYSIATLAYVADVLKALEESWRVLKPGGIMCHQGSRPLMTVPDLKEILTLTRGAWTFQMKHNHADAFWVATKEPEPEKYFRGFEYRLDRVANYNTTDADKNYPHRGQFKIGHYRHIY